MGKKEGRQDQRATVPDVEQVGADRKVSPAFRQEAALPYTQAVTTRFTRPAPRQPLCP
ncbi:hypothetical protein GCM10010844_25650 [Deinococcus radiotolerans]|uniref:Uncharacterized protein n=1 Tax=Deinococcus radiotolerans TaxID=1309407 RepID=A0ABQ2FK22_9DEIO|nr:hypothetical protein GCM10010844_25650 [Deinococcus radiotolerans]